jgi:hypothetical protein
MPTWIAPRLAPPERTNATGDDAGVMLIGRRGKAISYVDSPAEDAAFGDLAARTDAAER